MSSRTVLAGATQLVKYALEHGLQTTIVHKEGRIVQQESHTHWLAEWDSVLIR